MKNIDYNKMLKPTNIILVIAIATIITSCNRNGDRADAYGNFEVEETTISAQAGGELLQFNIEEGDLLTPGQLIGIVDSTTLVIQKGEIMANIASVKVNRTNIAAEKKVMDAEMANLKRELNRVRVLIQSQAATQKQLDDLEGNIEVLKTKTLALNSQYGVIDAQVKALEAKIALIDEQIRRCKIINPSNGMVLTKLARVHEIVAPGRPLYKIADMKKVYLKAYISETQLATIKQGQKVTVSVDDQDGTKEMTGIITWVSSESEFTPKIIQTKEERVNLVYGIKVAVENDGYLKLGMPGEINF